MSMRSPRRDLWAMPDPAVYGLRRYVVVSHKRLYRWIVKMQPQTHLKMIHY